MNPAPDDTYPADLYTESPDIDPDTLRHLGPLAPMAGVWEGARGIDVHPVAEGTEQEPFVERYELHPIDPQSNGPQLLYGLRYHTHVTRPNDAETFHDKVGYWLWEPATGRILHSLAIPRGQVALAEGRAAPDARTFTLRCEFGSPTRGTSSNPFLDQKFRTLEFRISVSIHDDGSWSYEQDTVLRIAGNDQLFHHVDRNTLRKVGEPKPNPLMRAAPRP